MCISIVISAYKKRHEDTEEHIQYMPVSLSLHIPMKWISSSVLYTPLFMSIHASSAAPQIWVIAFNILAT